MFVADVVSKRVEQASPRQNGANRFSKSQSHQIGQSRYLPTYRHEYCLVLQHPQFPIQSGNGQHDAKRLVVPNEGEEAGVAEIAARANKPGVERKHCARLKLKVAAIVEQPAGARLHLRSGGSQGFEPRRSWAGAAQCVYNQVTAEVGRVSANSVDLRHGTGLAQQADHAHTVANTNIRFFQYRLQECPFDQRPSDPEIDQILVSGLRVPANLAINVQLGGTDIQKALVHIREISSQEQAAARPKDMRLEKMGDTLAT